MLNVASGQFLREVLTDNRALQVIDSTKMRFYITPRFDEFVQICSLELNALFVSFP